MDDLRKRLKYLHRKRIEKAVNALLLDNDSASAKAHLDWAETAEKVATAIAPKPLRQSYLLGLFALFCLSLTLAAWSLHRSGNPVHLDVQADSISIRLDRDWALTADIRFSRMAIQQLKFINTASTGNKAASALELQDAAGLLKELKLAKGALLDLEITSRGLSLFVHSSAVQGTIEVREATLRLDGRNKSSTISASPDDPPEQIRFVSEQVAVPVRIDLETKGDWLLSGLSARGLAFQREEPSGSGNMVSSLYKAVGTFSETGRTFELAETDSLVLEGLQTKQLRIAGDAGKAKLTFQGIVDKVKGGPNGFVQELTPSWLEYLGHNQQTSLLWGSLVFLWGLAWKFRGML